MEPQGSGPKFVEKRLELVPAADLTSFLPGLAVRHAVPDATGGLWVLATNLADTQAVVLRHKGGAPVVLALDEPRGKPRFVAGLGKEEILTLSVDGQASTWDSRGRLASQYTIPGEVRGVHALERGIFVTHHGGFDIRHWSSGGTLLSENDEINVAMCVMGPDDILAYGIGHCRHLRGGVSDMAFLVSAHDVMDMAAGDGHVVMVTYERQRVVLRLWAMGKKRAQPVAAFIPQDRQGRPLMGMVRSRGGDMVLADGPRIHRFSVTDLVEA